MVVQVECVTADQFYAEVEGCPCTKPLASQVNRLSTALHKCCEELKQVLLSTSTVNNVQELIAQSKEVHSEWSDMKINIKAMQDAFRHTQRAAPGATVGG